MAMIPMELDQTYDDSNVVKKSEVVEKINTVQTLKTALTNMTFTVGTKVYEIRDPNSHNINGCLIMNSTTNNYGMGIYIGYYIDKAYLVINTNRNFTVKEINTTTV